MSSVSKMMKSVFLASAISATASNVLADDNNHSLKPENWESLPTFSLTEKTKGDVITEHADKITSQSLKLRQIEGDDGKPKYTVARDNKIYTDPSNLGTLFTDKPHLDLQFNHFNTDVGTTVPFEQYGKDKAQFTKIIDETCADLKRTDTSSVKLYIEQFKADFPHDYDKIENAEKSVEDLEHFKTDYCPN